MKYPSLFGALMVIGLVLVLLAQGCSIASSGAPDVRIAYTKASRGSYSPLYLRTARGTSTMRQGKVQLLDGAPVFTDESRLAFTGKPGPGKGVDDSYLYSLDESGGVIDHLEKRRTSERLFGGILDFPSPLLWASPNRGREYWYAGAFANPYDHTDRDYMDKADDRIWRYVDELYAGRDRPLFGDPVWALHEDRLFTTFDKGMLLIDRKRKRYYPFRPRLSTQPPKARSGGFSRFVLGLGFDVEIDKGEDIAYVLDKDRIMLVDLRRGKQSFVNVGRDGVGVSVSPDGRLALIQPRFDMRIADTELGPRIVASLDGSDLPLPGYYLVDMRTGKVRTIAKGKALGEPRWFPDSKRFITRTGKKRTDLGIVDIDRPNEIKVFLRDVNQWDVWFPPAKNARK